MSTRPESNIRKRKIVHYNTHEYTGEYPATIQLVTLQNTLTANGISRKNELEITINFREKQL